MVIRFKKLGSFVDVKQGAAKHSFVYVVGFHFFCFD
jgi:hypothetical protein